MATIAEIRTQYPQYKDMSDQQLADALHSKFYADMPADTFYAKVGLKMAPAQAKGPSAAEDFARSVPTGAKKAATSMPFDIAGQVINSNPVLGGVVKAGMSALTGAEGFLADHGVIPKAVPAVTRAALANPSGIANSLRQQATGKDYQPQGMAGRAGETLGSMLPNALAPGGVLQRAANVVAPAVGSVLAREGARAAGGSERVQEAAGALGGLAGGVAANLRVEMPQQAKRAPTPSLDDLRTAKTAAYQAVDKAGVQYAPEAVNGLVDTIKTKMQDGLIDPDLHPKATAVMKRIDSLKDQPITLPKLDQIRRLVRDNVIASPEKDQRRLGYQMLDSIDDFVASAGPKDVVGASDPDMAATTLNKARDLNTRVAKIESVESAKARAESRTKSTGSGGNIDNATRQEIRRVLERGRSWTPDERAALTQIVEGGQGQNALRTFGKMSPSGNGLMQAGNLIAAAKTGGLSLPVSAAAMVSKAVADGMTKGAVEKLVRLMADGGNAEAKAMLPKLKVGGSTVTALSANDGPRWQAPVQASQSRSALQPRP